MLIFPTKSNFVENVRCSVTEAMYEVDASKTILGIVVK